MTWQIRTRPRPGRRRSTKCWQSIHAMSPRIPIPRGTRESVARGYFTRKGPRQFVHVHDHHMFLKHYPTYKKQNPSMRHKYIFEGDIMSASNIIRILEQRQRRALMYNEVLRNRTGTRSTAGRRRSTRTRRPSVRIGTPSSATRRLATTRPAVRRRTTRRV